MLKNKITAVVLEESNSKLQSLTALLEKVPEIMLTGKSTHIEQGVSLVCNNMPQLVFVNVELKDASGFELVRKLHNRNMYPDIVFISDSSYLAFDALPLKPFDFLTEPVEKQDIMEMLERYKLKLKKKMLANKIEFLAKNLDLDTKRVFKYKSGIIVLRLDEILICKSNRSKTILVLKNGREVELSTSIKETIETINHNNFVKCSRSYWINRDYLRKIDKRRNRCIIYNNGKSLEVPVSRKSVQFFEALITYPVS